MHLTAEKRRIFAEGRREDPLTNRLCELLPINSVNCAVKILSFFGQLHLFLLILVGVEGGLRCWCGGILGVFWGLSLFGSWLF